MKRLTITLSIILSNCFMFGQTFDSALKKTDNEMYEVAQKEYQAVISKTTEPELLGEYYFFAGENYLKSDDLDSAIITWNTGINKYPENPFSLVAKGKIAWLQGDKTTAIANFEEAIKETRNKNVGVLNQIASTYIYSENKNLSKAVELLERSIELEPKCQTSHLILGDAQVEINPRNSSMAMKSYNNAASIKNNARVYVRKAKIYQRAQNPELADSLYELAQTIEPNYAPSYRERAELNMRYGKADKSIKNWEKYLELNDSDYARYRYATSLFVGKKYPETIQEIELLYKRGFKNFYTERILAYSIYENSVVIEADTTAYEKGYETLLAFFEIVPENEIVGADLIYKANYNMKLGNMDLYAQYMNEAVQIDPTVTGDVYTQMSATFMKNKQYDQAIEVYNKKMAGDSSNLTLAEYYQLGLAYYLGPKDFQKCDQAHVRILAQAPNYAASYLWRARANVQLDLLNEEKTWSPKAFYETFLSLLTDEQKLGAYKGMVTESLRYLGDYYVNSPMHDLEKAKEIWAKVLELNPEDPQATGFFKNLN